MPSDDAGLRDLSGGPIDPLSVCCDAVDLSTSCQCRACRAVRSERSLITMGRAPATLATDAIAAVLGDELDIALRRTRRSYRDLSEAAGIDDPTKLGRMLGRYPGLKRAESSALRRILTAALGRTRATDVLNAIQQHPDATPGEAQNMRNTVLKSGVTGSAAIETHLPITTRPGHLSFSDGGQLRLVTLSEAGRPRHVGVVGATYGSWAVVHGRLTTTDDRLTLDRLTLIGIVPDGSGPVSGVGRASGIGAAWAIGMDYADKHGGGPVEAPVLPPPTRAAANLGSARTSTDPRPTRSGTSHSLTAGR